MRKHVFCHGFGGAEYEFLRYLYHSVPAPELAFKICRVDKTVSIKKQTIAIFKFQRFYRIFGIGIDAEYETALFKVFETVAAEKYGWFMAAITIRNCHFFSVENCVKKGYEFSIAALCARKVVESWYQFA